MRLFIEEEKAGAVVDREETYDMHTFVYQIDPFERSSLIL